MQISKYIVNGPKSSNYVLLGIRPDVCVQKPPYHFLQTLHPLACLRSAIVHLSETIVFILSARLISASTGRNGYISNFCIMLELLH